MTQFDCVEELNHLVVDFVHELLYPSDNILGSVRGLKGVIVDGAVDEREPDLDEGVDEWEVDGGLDLRVDFPRILHVVQVRVDFLGEVL